MHGVRLACPVPPHCEAPPASERRDTPQAPSRTGNHLEASSQLSSERTGILELRLPQGSLGKNPAGAETMEVSAEMVTSLERAWGRAGPRSDAPGTGAGLGL